MKRFSLVRLDQVERIYLLALRIGVLAIATICLLCAAYFSIDAIWRMFVSTDVPVEATVVEPSEVSGAMRQFAEARDTEAESDGPQIPADIRQRHEAFMRDAFAPYYQVYAHAAEQYNKDEDDTLTAEDLADRLGYSLEIYAAGESPIARAFVEEPEFQRQLLAGVTAAIAEPATVTLLSQYRDAERVQQCTTRNVRQTVRQTCGYYYVYDCSYTRTVPQQQCQMVYPDGIVSPLAAFTQADQAFGELWAEQTIRHEGEAARIRAERHATRSQIGPKLMLALKIVGGFLVVMFFFLLVAVERHLRQLSKEAAGPDRPSQDHDDNEVAEAKEQGGAKPRRRARKSPAKTDTD